MTLFHATFDENLWHIVWEELVRIYGPN